jgi:hypothetical protein
MMSKALTAVSDAETQAEKEENGMNAETKKAFAAEVEKFKTRLAEKATRCQTEIAAFQTKFPTLITESEIKIKAFFAIVAEQKALIETIKKSEKKSEDKTKEIGAALAKMHE